MRTILSVLILSTCLFPALTISHERKNVGDMSVSFGGEPEPMLTGERQYLRWRFRDSKTEKPVSGLKDLQVTIKFAGKEFGPFDARGSRRNPGMYQTSLIFTVAGEGLATLNYKGGEKVKGFSVDFSFNVRAREEISIP